MRQEVARLVHHIHHQIAVLDADVDMHTEDEHAARHLCHFLDVVGIAILLRDVLGLPAGEGVGAGGDYPQAVGLCQLTNVRAQADQLFSRLLDVSANVAPYLHL